MEIINEDNYLDKNKNAILYGKNNSRGQFWKIKKNSDSTYFFINELSGYYLDVYDGQTAVNTNVHIHPYNGSNAQKWKPIRVLEDGMVTVNDVDVSSMDATVSPNVTVKVDSTTLKADTDYTVKVSADIESGKGTVTVTGKGNYCETVTKSFNITYNPPGVLGDVDGSGVIDASDPAFLLRTIVHYEVPTNVQENMMNGDVDGNGKLEAPDATFIQRYLVKYDVPYPVGTSA